MTDPEPVTEPRTEAGKRLLDVSIRDLVRTIRAATGVPDSETVPNATREMFAERIVAIEAEAATPPSPDRESQWMTDYVPPLQDIRDRDAQTEPVPTDRLPLGRGTKYDHARQQHSDYHLDSDEVAMGDRHVLLGLLPSTATDPEWTVSQENAMYVERHQTKGTP